ncbi:secondary thiamine-phosphate synthase enzyme YjbQ [Streptomyces sp. NPDC002536]
MTTVPRTGIDIISRRVMPPGSHLVLTARLRVTTNHPEENVDLTGQLHRLVTETGITEGTVHLYCGHTTCGLLVNEPEAGLEDDAGRALERLLPHSDHHPYAHGEHRGPEERSHHGERDNGHSHLRAMLATHPELHIPITNGTLYLGRWQAVMLAEHDGPRTRELLLRVHDDLVCPA